MKSTSSPTQFKASCPEQGHPVGSTDIAGLEPNEGLLWWQRIAASPSLLIIVLILSLKLALILIPHEGRVIRRHDWRV